MNAGHLAVDFDQHIGMNAQIHGGLLIGYFEIHLCLTELNP